MSLIIGNKYIDIHRGENKKEINDNLDFLGSGVCTTSLCSHIFLVLRDHGVYMYVVYI